MRHDRPVRRATTSGVGAAERPGGEPEVITPEVHPPRANGHAPLTWQDRVVSGIGDTLRAARLQRGDDLTMSATATGIGPKFLEFIEQERFDELPPTAHADDLVRRYATYLGIDSERLNVAGWADGDADTQEIPVVVAPQPRQRDSTLLWLGAGALIGVGGLIVLGGGLGSGDPPATPTTAAGTAPRPPTATTATAPAGDAPAPPTLRPAPPTRATIELRLNARAGKTVWVEVRRGDVGGPQLFAGIVGNGTTRVIRSRAPLWLGVAWAPNVAIALNGEEFDAEGGTEAYRVTARGVTRLPTS